jgi:hypothetical protein
MYVSKFHISCDVIGSLLDGTVVRKPRLHRARGLGDGLGRQNVWAAQRLLERERGWRGGYSGQVPLISYWLKSLIPLSLSAQWQTTASDSALASIVAARTRYLSEYPDTTLESLVVYVTTQTHSLGTKAAKILGLRVRALDVDVAVVTDNTGLTGHVFRTAVEEDRARGLHPFALGKCFLAPIFWTLAEPFLSRHRWNDILRRR